MKSHFLPIVKTVLTIILDLFQKSNRNTTFVPKDSVKMKSYCLIQDKFLSVKRMNNSAVYLLFTNSATPKSTYNKLLIKIIGLTLTTTATHAVKKKPPILFRTKVELNTPLLTSFFNRPKEFKKTVQQQMKIFKN